MRTIKLVSAEINDEAISIERYKFNFSRPVCIIVGHESTGIPIELVRNSDSVYIPMPGVGYCLNTSQTGNIMLYEAVKQFEAQENLANDWKEHLDIHYP